MKILKIEIKDFKKLENVELDLDGKSVIITGPNQSGKSSVLDAIFDTITNSETALVPIRQGQQKATIALTIGDDKQQYVVEKKFTEKGTYLQIKTPDGASYNKPVETLNRLFGRVHFDMYGILNAKNAKEIGDEIKKFLNIDTSEIDKEYEKAFKERTAINKEVNSLKELVDENMMSIQQISEEKVKAEEDLSLVKKNKLEYDTYVSNKQKGEAIISNIKYTIKEKESQIERDEQKIKELQESIEKNKKEVEIEKQKLEQADEKMQKLLSVIDKFAESIATYDTLYGKVIQLQSMEESVKKNETMKQRLVLKQKEANDLTEKLEKCKEDKAKIMSNFKLGNLEFNEQGHAIYEGLPLDIKQINTAELAKIAIRLVFAARPKLESIRFDASMFDNKNFNEVMKELHNYGYQAFIEMVDKDGEELAIEIYES